MLNGPYCTPGESSQALHPQVCNTRGQVDVEIKQQTHELIDTLPETPTWAEVRYALQVRADVEAGVANAKAGRGTSVEDLRIEYCLTR